ncbi:transposase [Flavobacterium cupreum]|uniref:Transposase n=2 Tax=Flavobacterium TaxID=237 RepID=A0A434A553_9FLAO|nr:DDE-type integrase/transposase/recombinase [Flavobacterium cupreum]RUT69457.1 transposase [Flavobacterium cupreum]
MISSINRNSWDTNVKHYIRNGLYDNLPEELKSRISKTNKHRWQNESENKYLGCEINAFIKEELELIKSIGSSNNSKKVIKAYFKLSQTYHEIFNSFKSIKNHLSKYKEKIVNVIEIVKETIPIEDALKVFNISRGTYQNYKTLVINKCDASYFLWCTKQYPHQLLKKEIFQIKKYLEDEKYRYWSKSSVYFLGIRNRDISICLTTFYKYSTLLGYQKSRYIQPKTKYSTLKSYKPNEVWCADVTILKTLDGKKHYIHFLMDHFSKMILGYRVEDHSSPAAIKHLLQKAYLKNKNNDLIQFITDGGIENVNSTVKDFIASTNDDIKHLIAQKDIPFSNSKIEAFNKIIKHQFLLPRNLENRKQLTEFLSEDVYAYNNVRPQFSLQGNTPEESFSGKPIAIIQYKTHFTEQKINRITVNQQNQCKSCSK